MIPPWTLVLLAILHNVRNQKQISNSNLFLFLKFGLNLDFILMPEAFVSQSLSGFADELFECV